MEAMSDLLLTHTHDTSTDIHFGEAFASPLLMTVLEQVVAKVDGKLMTPSDTLAVFTFLRQLLVRLASKQGDEGYGGLHAILHKLETSASGGQPFPDHSSIGFGIRRELSIARVCLRHLGNDDCRHTSERSSDKTVADFLDRIEQIPVREFRFMKRLSILLSSPPLLHQPRTQLPRRLLVWLVRSSWWTGFA
jgi:nucleolar pre-ribosomal-associated protein 1